MPTLVKVKGRIVKVWIDDDPVSQGGAGNKQLAGCQTDSSMNKTTSELNAECKDDGVFGAYIPDKNEATFDLSFLVHYAATLNYEELDGIWKAQKICELTYSTNVVGDPEEVFICFLTSLNKGTPLEGIATIDTSWRITEEPDLSAVSA